MNKFDHPHVLVAARRHGGTHLINPLVKRIAGIRAISADKQGTLLTPQGKLVVFMRDPRNIFTSRIRWKLRAKGRPEVPSPELDEHMVNRMQTVTAERGNIPQLAGKQWVACHRTYWKHYLDIKGGHHLRFEDLTDPQRMNKSLNRLRKYLESDADSAAIFGSLFKHGTYYSGNFSSWERWWGPLAREEFARQGGPDLLALMGYKE